jgi:hypothetical protein
MHYVRIENRYKRFFESGKSVFRKEITIHKREFVQKQSLGKLLLLLRIFNRYINDDILINWV